MARVVYRRRGTGIGTILGILTLLLCRSGPPPVAVLSNWKEKSSARRA